jgi:hypothetical protein
MILGFAVEVGIIKQAFSLATSATRLISGKNFMVFFRAAGAIHE